MAKSPVYIAIESSILNAHNIIENSKALPAHLKNFISSAITACDSKGYRLDIASDHAHKALADNSNAVIREEFRQMLKTLGHPSSESLVSTRLKELAASEVVKLIKAIDSDNRNIVVYHFDTLEAVLNLGFDYQKSKEKKSGFSRRTKKEVAVQRELFIGSKDISFLEGDEVYSDYYIEGLISGVLDTAVRISTKDKRETISTNYSFLIRNDQSSRWKEEITINTSCLTEKDSSIMVLSDQRCIRALNTMFIEHIRKRYGRSDNFDGKDIKNQFIFDIVDLCKQIGLDPSGANLESTRKMLARLKDTVFNIDAHESPWFRKKYLMGADKMEYRYCVEWYAKTEEQEVIKDGESQIVKRAERYYVIKFHDMVFHNLLNMAHVFISHPELRSEKSGIAHRFNNWCKAFIGVRPIPGKEQFVFQLDDLHSQVMNSSRLDNFCRDFVSLLSRECVSGDWQSDGANRSWIYGYIVEYDGDENNITHFMKERKKGRRRGGKLYPVVTISRDKTDPIVGDESKHNRLLRHEIKTAL